MLTRLRSLVPQWRQLNHRSYSFLLTRAQNPKQLTEKHIAQANTITDLFWGLNIKGLSENALFQTLMRKLTKILLTSPIDDVHSLDCIQKFLFELRKLSSTQTHATSSDLLNYQLLFKQLTRIIPKNYQPKGFETRASMVAEFIPRIASFQGCDPAAMALLHYMGTHSRNSKPEMKKHLHNYFMRCNLTQKLSQTSYNSGVSVTQNSVQNNIKLSFNDESCLILLSSSGVRSTETTIQQKLLNLALFNLNKNMLQSVTKFLNMAELGPLYKSFELQSRWYDPKFVKQHLNNNPHLSKFSGIFNEDGSPRLVLNTEQKFLQAADLFIKMITRQYRTMISYEINYKSTILVFRYFYSVFFVSQDMKIWVSTQKSSHENWIFEPKHQQKEQKLETKQIFLWKVASFILEGLLKNKIYFEDKDKFYQLLVYKIMQFVQKESVKTKLGSQLKRYFPHIIKILGLLPIQQMQEYCERFPQINTSITNLIKKIVLQLPEQSQLRLEIIKNILGFVKLKNVLFITKKQWIDIFKTLIRQDKKLQFWELYFQLASSGDPQLIYLIPFGNMVSHLSSLRHDMEKEKKYISCINEESMPSNKKIDHNIASLSRRWELDLLRLQALLIHCNKEEDLELLLKNNCTKYEIKLAEVEALLSTWLQPFRINLLFGLEVITAFERETLTSLGPIDYQDKPIAFYGNYFNGIFIKTGCFYQFRLIEKIINRFQFESCVLSKNNFSNHHFLSYFFTILFGFGSGKLRPALLKKYPVKNLINEEFSVTNFFKYKYMQKVVSGFCQMEQWDYLFYMLDKIGSLLNAQDIYFSYLFTHELRLSSLAQANPRISPYKMELNQIGSLNLNHLLTKKNLIKKHEFNMVDYIKLSKSINKWIIKSMKSSQNISQQFNNIAWLCGNMYQICRLNHEDYKNILSHILEVEDIGDLKKIIKSVKPMDSIQLSILLFHAKMIGIFDEDMALHFLKTFTFTSPVKLARLFCIATIGRQKAQQHKFVNAGDWDKLDNEIYLISSQIKHSTIWLYTMLRICGPSRYESLVNISRNVVHPIEKKMISEELSLFKKKYKLEEVKIRTHTHTEEVEEAQLSTIDIEGMINQQELPTQEQAEQNNEQNQQKLQVQKQNTKKILFQHKQNQNKTKPTTSEQNYPKQKGLFKKRPDRLKNDK